MRPLTLRAGTLLLLAALSACGGGSAGVSGNSDTAQPAPLLPALTNSVAATNSVGLQSANSEGLSAPSSGTLGIDAGGQATASGWTADSYFSGGASAVVSTPIDVSRVTNPAPQSVYQSQRYGPNFTYSIPHLTANGQYSVVLEFVESFFSGPGQRIFNVNINGTLALSAFDIFQAAGGSNIAVTRQFETRADASGKIGIQLVATKNEATIAGIAISAGSSTATPGPTPEPAGDTLPWVYAELWSNSSPLRTTVAELKSRGATTVPHTYMQSLWNQGIAGNGPAQEIPIYVSKSSDPLLTVMCTQYGGNCNAKNVQIHVSPYATQQNAGDGHLTIVDPNAPSGPIELDCFQAAVSGSRLACSWAGVFKFGSSGLDTNGSDGIHMGVAVTSIFTVGQELENGHIDHALGMNAVCLNNPTVYPADTSNGTDTACNGSADPPHYGNLMHLLWSSAQIAGSAYSKPCKVILTALATYGAYLDDTGDNGLQLSVENEISYTALPSTRGLDPWPDIYAKLESAGDGNRNSWQSCLNRLTASDFELLQIAQP